MPVAQAEASDLAGADVDVVGTGQVAVLRAAEEAEAVREDLQHAFAVHQAVLADAGAEDLEDQVLLFESDEVLDVFLLGDLVQGLDVHLLEVLDVELATLDLLVLGVGFGVEGADVFAGRVGVARGGGGRLLFGRRDSGRGGGGGFFDSVAVKSGLIARRYLALDQAMVMGAVGNVFGNDLLRRAFGSRTVESRIRPLIAMEQFGSGLE